MRAAIIFGAYARQNQEANAKAISILDEKFSIAARQEQRGSYYGSLEGLVKHIEGGAIFFHKMFKEALSDKFGDKFASVFAAIDSIEKHDEKPLDINGWKSLKSNIAALDRAWVVLTERLGENDYEISVKAPWLGDGAPLGYMFASLAAHNMHHRGQISQILDENKIDNNYSGIDFSFWK